MKVIDFIKRLEEIGYDENTELTFSCIDVDTDDFYYLKLNTTDGDGFCYSKNLDGNPYDKKEINIELDVDGCKDYIEAKQYYANEALDKIERIVGDYNYNMRYKNI